MNPDTAKEIVEKLDLLILTRVFQSRLDRAHAEALAGDCERYKQDLATLIVKGCE